ncbi:MAG: GNAT family N-acetyltransferase [Gammaproteobacteria bacterium]|nr:GNAT family N-acetyltransferase [Gammaproteobacteria bacterium]MDH3534408.1 GNAT family N-acetyltransferase [Gammaproteobacteria bacterium]
MKTELRQASTQDLPQLLPLVRAYHEFEHIDSSETLRESALRRLLADPGCGGIWMIHADNLLAGYIALCRGFSIEFNGFDAFIDEFYLNPEFRGKGVGKAVLEAIKQEARKLEINAIHLEVARDNDRARVLYRAAGFEARDKYLPMSLMLDD